MGCILDLAYWSLVDVVIDLAYWSLVDVVIDLAYWSLVDVVILFLCYVYDIIESHYTYTPCFLRQFYNVIYHVTDKVKIAITNMSRFYEL